jgi:hypothetical protein
VTRATGYHLGNPTHKGHPLRERKIDLLLADEEIDHDFAQFLVCVLLLIPN